MSGFRPESDSGRAGGLLLALEEGDDSPVQAGFQLLATRHIVPGTDKGEPWPYQQPTWVFTRRDIPKAPNADIRFVKGDVRPGMRK